MAANGKIHFPGMGVIGTSLMYFKDYYSLFNFCSLMYLTFFSRNQQTFPSCLRQGMTGGVPSTASPGVAPTPQARQCSTVPPATWRQWRDTTPAFPATSRTSDTRTWVPVDRRLVRIYHILSLQLVLFSLSLSLVAGERHSWLVWGVEGKMMNYVLGKERLGELGAEKDNWCGGRCRVPGNWISFERGRMRKILYLHYR